MLAFQGTTERQATSSGGEGAPGTASDVHAIRPPRDRASWTPSSTTGLYVREEQSFERPDGRLRGTGEQGIGAWQPTRPERRTRPPHPAQGVPHLPAGFSAMTPARGVTETPAKPTVHFFSPMHWLSGYGYGWSFPKLEERLVRVHRERPRRQYSKRKGRHPRRSALHRWPSSSSSGASGSRRARRAHWSKESDGQSGGTSALPSTIAANKAARRFGTLPRHCSPTTYRPPLLRTPTMRSRRAMIGGTMPAGLASCVNSG